MVQITGSYVHEKNENLDDYFKAVGVPYIPRKLMAHSSPSLEIKQEDDEWTISTITMLRTAIINFKLGEEYEEHMPGGVIKSTTTLEDGDKLVTKSIGPGDSKITRIYEFSETGCVINLKHEASGKEAKRYFKRA